MADEHQAHQHHHHAASEADTALFTELLDLDGEILSSYLSEVTGWVRELAANRPVRRVLDLGTGTGNGAIALARLFGAAEVIAVDQSAEFLSRLSAKAAVAGVADRIRTIEADLDGPWPVSGTVDVVWTSLVLHHLADPDRALAEIYAAIEPDGLLAVAEMSDTVRFLPHDLGLGRPGFEDRYHEAAGGAAKAAMPLLGADWGPHLSGAGFTDVIERRFDIEVTPPLPAAAGRYLQLSLHRAHGELGDTLAEDDLATLGALISDDGPHSVRRRQDLTIRGTRTLWTGRHP
ncbi:MAG TPA: class I SAM-dependent methyltransferase [Streptosporangiaceae bacterium]|nr:class I SAM-dependent methyltransferase [Streptosporangiaceae bacterium]